MGFPANGATADQQLKFLIYGKTGWIGGPLGKICQDQSIGFEYGSGRLENRASLEADIAAVRPTYVFNAAGVTGRPNVDWCESHKVETIRTNGEMVEPKPDTPLIPPLSAPSSNRNLPDFKKSIKLKYVKLGYHILITHGMYLFLSPLVVVITAQLSTFSLRDLYDLWEHLQYNLISVIICSTLLVFLSTVYFLTLLVSHNEILEMYKQYIDPSFTWKNFNLEEQAKVIVAPERY